MLTVTAMLLRPKHQRSQCLTHLKSSPTFIFKLKIRKSKMEIYNLYILFRSFFIPKETQPMNKPLKPALSFGQLDRNTATNSIRVYLNGCDRICLSNPYFNLCLPKKCLSFFLSSCITSITQVHTCKFFKWPSLLSVHLIW